MRMSTLSARRFGFSLLLIAGTVGCAQSGTGVPASPTAPSSLSVGSSAAAPSSLSVGPSAAALGPGASYNASGWWRFVTTDVHGNVESTFDTNVTQDGNGNLSFTDEDGAPITLERLGTGVIITYRLSLISDEGGDCDVRVKGTARLDTRTHTMTVPIRLKELGCSNERLGLVVTGTKLR